VPRLKQVGIDVDVNRVIENARRTLAESHNDILRRLLLGELRLRPSQSANPRRAATDEPVRLRGLWSVEVKGERLPAANLKDAYRVLLLKLDSIAPRFLDQFSQERSRSRRFVALNPADLYDSAPHLAADHAKLLNDDWYFDTNLSTEQVAKRARVAARVAGLTYGRDVKVMENLRLI
jgi:negative regulator of replication initiation